MRMLAAAIFAVAMLGATTATPASAQSLSLPSIANGKAVTALEERRPVRPEPPVRPKPRPVPGPVAGAGLPLLLIAAAYVLLRRRRQDVRPMRDQVSADQHTQ